ncbi:MAG: nitroreductase family protein [Promethearchaeota archaeon]|jgi:nitroreductase/NAD-dependent dihydropyrimidine dehydrogenase PreA subunit
MSITGIDKDKCSNCKQCIQVCLLGYISVNKDGQVCFEDDFQGCGICGHCMAICPEDAILTQNLNDIDTLTKVDSPQVFVDSENLLKLFRAKRSIRRYKNKQVSKELIKKVFNAMRYAPSAGNLRKWRYVVLSDPEKIQRLNDEIVKTNYTHLGFQSEEQALEAFKSERRSLFYHAPHLIVLYYDDPEFLGLSANPVFLGFGANDAGIAMTYGMLEAYSLGLGTCWVGHVQGAAPANKEVLKILGIEGMVLGAFTLGYPAVTYRRLVSRPPLKIKGIE